MADYIQVDFQQLTADQAEMLVAALSEAGFEGFEEGDGSLKGFIPAAAFDEVAVRQIAEQLRTGFTHSFIRDTNWNAVWESNFEPVVVDDFVGLRADFHPPVSGVDQEIVITPKMSFGTGHHATTYMMIRQMRDISFAGKTVFDFGTGTGILAILAERLGATDILAIDNDDWSISNTTENLERNQCSRVRAEKAETVPARDQFDIILANINKNVILENMQALAAQLAPEGTLLLSGLLAEDEADIMAAAEARSLHLTRKEERNGWICLRLNR